jgi:hypothetical protein
LPALFTRVDEQITVHAEVATLADHHQYEAASGPCVDAVAKEHSFCTNDLAHDPRWLKPS